MHNLAVLGVAAGAAVMVQAACSYGDAADLLHLCLLYLVAVLKLATYTLQQNGLLGDNCLVAKESICIMISAV